MGNSKTLKTSHDQARGRDQLILDYSHNLHYGTYLEASSALAVLAQDGHLGLTIIVRKRLWKVRLRS